MRVKILEFYGNFEFYCDVDNIPLRGDTDWDEVSEDDFKTLVLWAERHSNLYHRFVVVKKPELTINACLIQALREEAEAEAEEAREEGNRKKAVTAKRLAKIAAKRKCNAPNHDVDPPDHVL